MAVFYFRGYPEGKAPARVFVSSDYEELVNRRDAFLSVHEKNYADGISSYDGVKIFDGVA